jgi:putative SOS response-associated peptidase YedK
MLGRFNVTAWSGINEWMRADYGIDALETANRYNITPSQTVPVITSDEVGSRVKVATAR